MIGSQYEIEHVSWALESHAKPHGHTIKHGVMHKYETNYLSH